MRIIGGSLKRQHLDSPRDALTTRPMPDHVREAVYNLLRGHSEGAHVFDAFAGTGAVGLEAVSRGAERCVLVERDRKVAAILRANVDRLGVGDRCEVVVGDALGAGALARCPKPADLIFFDPPYPIVRDPAGWRRVRRQFEAAIGRLADTGFATIRTPWPFVHLEEPAGAEAEDERPTKRRGKDRGKEKRRGGGRRKGWYDETEVEASLTIDDADGELSEAMLEAFERGEEDDFLEEAGPKPPPPTPIDPDMTFETAEGPETHVYGSTAIHLYMRKRAPDSEADSDPDPDASAVDSRDL